MSNKLTESILEECHDTGLFLQESPLRVNDTNILGDSPLHLVCSWDDVEAVTALLVAGAKVNAKGDNKQTPLFRVESVQVADLLLSAGADPTLKDEFDETAETYLRSVGLVEVAAHIGLQAKRS
ncbi:ankyrin repeat domain-containing protein [Pelagibius sp.]|uniref:ankyrin repeat domain-containing protein n=1 Tax=Pelagibius sp. TaxID=1931238 RepID=UPI003B50AC5E